MRILLSSRPLTGHVQPLVPLAAAAARRGHEVAFATGEPAVSDLRERGFHAFVAGRGREARMEFDPRAREVEALPPEDRRMVFFAELFVGIELAPRLDGLLRVIEDWRPDVLLHEAAELAGPIAATLAGIPYATVGFGARFPARVLERGAAAAAPHWRAHGLEPPANAGLYRYLYVDPFPPSLQLSEPAPADVQPARLTPFVETDGASAPAWLATLQPQPTLYVTFGTIWNRQSELFRRVLAAVEGLAVNVIVTLGASGDPEALGPQPGNVHVHRFVPQALVLPACDMVVCHGGSGTMLGALAHGLPLVVLPQGADQFANADLLAATGAGRTLLSHECDPPLIRRAVTALLVNAGPRAAAARLRDELDAMPAPGVAIARVEALAG